MYDSTSGYHGVGEAGNAGVKCYVKNETSMVTETTKIADGVWCKNHKWPTPNG